MVCKIARSTTESDATNRGMGQGTDEVFGSRSLRFPWKPVGLASRGYFCRA